jgi:predicted RND superfamily exporter protein
VEAADGDLFTVQRLQLIRDLAKSVAKLEGVERTTSITELRDLTVARDAMGEEQAVVDNLVGDLPPADAPDIGAKMQALRARVLARDHVRGSLIAEDAAATLLLVNFSGEGNLKAHADRVRAHVDAAVAAAGGPVRIHYGGAPFVGSFVAATARADIVNLSPWVSLAIVVIVLLTARSLVGALIALSSVGFGIVWVLGLIGLIGRPLTLVSSSLPMLLMALGSAYSIHLLAKILDNLDQRGPNASRRDAVLDAVGDVGPPILVAGLTTAAGFISFLVMDIAPMREFGWLMSLGTVVVVFLGIVVVAAAGVLFPMKAQSGGRTPAWMTRLITGGSGVVLRAPWLVVLLGGLAGVTAPQGFTGVRTHMDMRAFFDAQSEPVESEDFLEARLGGSVFLQLETAGDLTDPVALRQIDRLVTQAAAQPKVTDVQAVTVPVLLAAEGMIGDARVPNTVRQIRAIAELLRDEPNLDLLVDAEWSRAAMQVKLGAGADAVRMAHALRDGAATTIGGPRSVVARTALTETQGAVERAEVAAHVRDALAAYGGGEVSDAALDAALGAVKPGPAAAARIADVVRSQIVDDEMIYLREPPELESPAGEQPEGDGAPPPLEQLIAALQSRVAAGTLTPDATYEAVFAQADAEERADPKNLRTATDFLHRNLVAGTLGALVDARVAALGDAVPADATPRLRKAVRRSLAVLDEPEVSLPASAVGDAKPLRTVALTTRVTGFPLVYEGMNRSVQANQTNSLMVAALLVVVTLSIFFGSPVLGVLAGLPAGLTLMAMFSIMGAAGIPMDVGTSMIASIALGVGIDYAVHLVWRYRQLAGTPEERIARLGTTGWGIVINALEVTVGFGILMLGTLVPMRNVGFLTASAMVISAATTLLLMPALLRWLDGRRGGVAEGSVG